MNSSIFYSNIALVFFLTFFVGVLVWTFRPGQKKRLEDLSRHLLFDNKDGEQR